MGFEKDSLIVFAGDVVSPETRFMTDELAAIILEMQNDYNEKGLLAITKPDNALVKPSENELLGLEPSNQLRSSAELEAQRMGNIYNTLNKPAPDRQPVSPEQKKGKQNN